MFENYRWIIFAGIGDPISFLMSSSQSLAYEYSISSEFPKVKDLLFIIYYFSSPRTLQGSQEQIHFTYQLLLNSMEPSLNFSDGPSMKEVLTQIILFALIFCSVNDFNQGTLLRKTDCYHYQKNSQNFDCCYCYCYCQNC